MAIAHLAQPKTKHPSSTLWQPSRGAIKCCRLCQIPTSHVDHHIIFSRHIYEIRRLAYRRIMLGAASFIRSSGRSCLGGRRLHDGAWWELPQHTWRRRLGWQMRRLHAGGFRLCLEGWRLGLSKCLREKKRSWMLLSRRSRRTRRGRASWEAWQRRRKRRRL